MASRTPEKVLTLTLGSRSSDRQSQMRTEELNPYSPISCVTRSFEPTDSVSDDNPFSEAQFKTLKYHPSFPGAVRDDQNQAKTLLSLVLPCGTIPEPTGSGESSQMLTPRTRSRRG